MSAESQDGGPDPALMGRRDALKLAAGAGAGAMALSGKGIPDDFEPIGTSNALSFDDCGYKDAVKPLIFMPATLGVVANCFNVDGDTSLDEEEVFEDNVYEVGSSVAEGRSVFVEEMANTYGDASVPSGEPEQETPFGDSAWSSVRAAAVREIAAGESESTATSAAQDALDKQATISWLNIVQRWNTGVKALIEQISSAVDQNSMAIHNNNDPFEKKSTHPSDYEAILDGIGYKYDAIDLPVDPTKIDDLDYTSDNPPVIYFLYSGSAYNASGPLEMGNTDYPQNFVSDTSVDTGLPRIKVEHSELGTKDVLWGLYYFNALRDIEVAHSEIANNLSTYVSNLYDAIQQGAIDLNDVLTGEDISEHFADSSDQKRLAHELLAAGADVPQNVGFQAEISHPDLAADSLWGWLYPQFASGVTKEISAGMTLPSTDYKMAYFGYEGEASGEFETTVLSGDSDLQILDLSGLPDEQDLTVVEDETAGENGRVTIWEGEEENAPDPIRYPADHSGWVVKIVGATNSDTVPVSNIETTTNDDGTIEYYASSTGLSAGELIEHKAIVPSSTYDQPVEYVSDPTTVNETEVIERIETINKRIEEIEEITESSTTVGGSLFGDIDVPTLGPIDTVGEWALAIGGTLVGSIAVGNLTN